MRHLVPDSKDEFDLERFVAAQAGQYENAISELRAGLKRSHWMWFIFPQIDGLGTSSISRRFAIKSFQEALAYLDHPILGAHLVECANALISLEGRSASEIFGFPDDSKLKSSMTLFATVADHGTPFRLVLDKYFGGDEDHRTLQILDALASPDAHSTRILGTHSEKGNRPPFSERKLERPQS